MRIAVASMMHETNTFTALRTPLEDFHPVHGEAVYDSAYWLEETPVGGIINVLRKNEVEIVPIYFAGALPSGIVTSSAYQEIKEQIVSGIEQNADNLDGICLAMHGSMFVEELADPEGDLLIAIRELVPDLPIACALDMHGTITDTMISNANILVGYKTAPHVDIVETGARASELLLLSLREQRPLLTRRSYLPLMVSGEQSETDEAPMNELLPLLAKIESTAGVVSASIFVGFVWADNPYGGMNAVVVGDESAVGVVEEQAKWLAERVWERRADFQFTTETWQFSEAVDKALEDPRQPIIISDAGDNPTAGAAQDLAIVVKELVEKKVNSALVVAVVDPQAVQKCFAAQEGDLLQLSLGRSGPQVDAEPYSISAKLVARKEFTDNKFAVVDKDGVVVVIASERFAVTDPTLLEQLGLRPGEFKLIVIKSGYVSPEYQKIAARKMFALTAGDTNLLLSELKYERVRRPIYPLDDI